MKEYLVVFAQTYPNFRRAELESLAEFHGITVDLSHHRDDTPFLRVWLENDDAARKIMERAVLARAIYELWGYGTDLPLMHADVKLRSSGRFSTYKTDSFKFDIISYKGSRSPAEKREIIESFAYVGFDGPIRMKGPQHVFTVLEEYATAEGVKATFPENIWFGRQIAVSARTNNVLDTYDLKHRTYIGTTSFDAELSLVLCNIAQVAPGKMVYDPFAGTGSFLVASAYFGGWPVGSDIDMRALRGKKQRTIAANFRQYGTSSKFVDVLAMDFTNNALRKDLVIDTIVCDPPYGVREGLKVCGVKDAAIAEKREKVVINGEAAHRLRDFIAPKKPYDLASLLMDLLEFAASRLPVGGRLAFWMPTANDDFEEHILPQHAQLELLHALEQGFNKWLRRLVVYVKRNGEYVGSTVNGLKENNIAHFRERYFCGFNEKSRWSEERF